MITINGQKLDKLTLFEKKMIFMRVDVNVLCDYLSAQLLLMKLFHYDKMGCGVRACAHGLPSTQAKVALIILTPLLQ